LVDNIIGENTETILFFTNKGNYYHMKMGEFIVGEKQYLSNYFSINGDDVLTAAVGVNPNNVGKNIIFVTKNGLIKKSKLSEYNMKRNTGAIALKLDAGDEIISILIMEDERLGIMSKSGQFIMVATSPIKAIGRVTRGIIGMKLATGDTVVAARAIPANTTQLFSIATDGYGKTTSISEFNITGTNTKGVKIQKAESMCDFIPVVSQSDILINSNTTQIRIKYNDIPNLSRGAQGTKLIKLTNNYVIGISSL
jgi:DNA gyrase subunit A